MTSSQKNDELSNFLKQQTKAKEFGIKQFIEAYGKFPILVDDYQEQLIAMQNKEIAPICPNSPAQELLGNIPKLKEILKTEKTEDSSKNNFQENYNLLQQLNSLKTAADDYKTQENTLTTQEIVKIKEVEEPIIRDVPQKIIYHNTLQPADNYFSGNVMPLISHPRFYQKLHRENLEYRISDYRGFGNYYRGNRQNRYYR